jgi:hypothetical protein
VTQANDNIVALAMIETAPRRQHRGDRATPGIDGCSSAASTCADAVRRKTLDADAPRWTAC